MGFWHIYWIGQHFSWDVSCMQLNCSREGSRVLQVQNPIKESTGYNQMASSLEAEQVHTHTVPRPRCPNSPPPAPLIHAVTGFTTLTHCTETHGTAMLCRPTRHTSSQEACSGLTAQPRWSTASTQQPFLLGHHCNPQQKQGHGSSFSYPGGWVCVSSSEGVLEESQFLKTSTLSAFSHSYRKGHRLYSVIKLYMPENPSQFHRERVTRES